MYYTPIDICPSNISFLLSGQFYSEVRSAVDTYGIRNLLQISNILAARIGVAIQPSDIVRSIDVHTRGQYFKAIESTSLYEKVLAPLLVRDVLRTVYNWLYKKGRSKEGHRVLKNADLAFKSFLTNPKIAENFRTADTVDDLKTLFAATYNYCVNNDLVRLKRA